MAERLKIISLSIHHLSFEESLEQVMKFALDKRSSYICFANVHMTIEAYKDRSFREKINKADLVLADGKPIAASCKLLHKKKQERISGMDFIPRILTKANEKNLSIFIYGSTNEVINALKEKINIDLPNIYFAGAISPLFRELTSEEIKNDIEEIINSGAHLVLVSLGCPKQEKWMAENSPKINAVLLGVGGALPVAAGIQKRAPKWMQNMSLEWLYRLIQQPKRLFTRYLYTNSWFIFLLGKNWVKKIFQKR
jgi:N-acetylglucosaminyldiphosphoundecaprenol N-acetyl-beta-D-mannosaminyltransferase